MTLDVRGLVFLRRSSHRSHQSRSLEIHVILGGVVLGIGLSLLGQRPAHIHTRIPFHLYAHLRSGSYPLDNITGIGFSTTTKSFFHTLAPLYLADFKPIAVIKVRSESQQRPDQCGRSIANINAIAEMHTIIDIKNADDRMNGINSDRCMLTLNCSANF